MINLFLYALAISISVLPPVYFDLGKFTYPPPFFPFYYPSLDYTHMVKLEYEIEPSETLKSLEVYIRGYGELPEGMNFSNFLFSTEDLPLPQGNDISGWIPLSSSWKKIGEFPCKMKKGEAIFPLIFIFRVNREDKFYNIEKFDLKFQFRVNAK